MAAGALPIRFLAAALATLGLTFPVPGGAGPPRGPDGRDTSTRARPRLCWLLMPGLLTPHPEASAPSEPDGSGPDPEESPRDSSGSSPGAEHLAPRRAAYRPAIGAAYPAARPHPRLLPGVCGGRPAPLASSAQAPQRLPVLLCRQIC